jgi:hypothetical protein
VLLSTLLQDIHHPSHHLLNVLLQTTNKLGLSNKKKTYLFTINTQLRCITEETKQIKIIAHKSNIHTSFLTEPSDNPIEYCNGSLLPLQMEKFPLFECSADKALSGINLFS